jgi:hypothetical protein
MAVADAYAVALGTLLVLQVLAFAWYASGRYALVQRAIAER